MNDAAGAPANSRICAAPPREGNNHTRSHAPAWECRLRCSASRVTHGRPPTVTPVNVTTTADLLLALVSEDDAERRSRHSDAERRNEPHGSSRLEEERGGRVPQSVGSAPGVHGPARVHFKEFADPTPPWPRRKKCRHNSPQPYPRVYPVATSCNTQAEGWAVSHFSGSCTSNKPTRPTPWLVRWPPKNHTSRPWREV